MPIIEIPPLSHPEVEIFSILTEAQLRNCLGPEKGLLIIGNPKIIKVALNTGYEPLAILCKQKRITGDTASIIERCGDIPVYTGNRELLVTLTRHALTRGVLCVVRLPVLRSVEEVCWRAGCIMITDGVVDTANIGAIFRSMATPRIDTVLFMRDSYSPLNRRVIRASTGAVFLVSWIWLDGPFGDLTRWGFRTVAMALTDNPISIGDPVPTAEPELAIVMDTGGDGFSHERIAKTGYAVRIPMSHGVDSLNVVAVFAIAFWQLRVGKEY